MTGQLVGVVLYALAVVFVAVAFAAGVRIVEWLVGDPVDVWRATVALFGAALGGGGIIAYIRGRT